MINKMHVQQSGAFDSSGLCLSEHGLHLSLLPLLHHHEHPLAFDNSALCLGSEHGLHLSLLPLLHRHEHPLVGSDS